MKTQAEPIENEPEQRPANRIPNAPRNRRELRAALALSRSKTKLQKAKNGLRSAKRR